MEYYHGCVCGGYFQHSRSGKAEDWHLKYDDVTKSQDIAPGRRSIQTKGVERSRTELVLQKQTKGQWAKAHKEATAVGDRARKGTVNSTMESEGLQGKGTGSQLKTLAKHDLIYSLKCHSRFCVVIYLRKQYGKNAKFWLILFQKDYHVFSSALRVYQMIGRRHHHSPFQGGEHISLRISQWTYVVFEMYYPKEQFMS